MALLILQKVGSLPVALVTCYQILWYSCSQYKFSVLNRDEIRVICNS
jgi:hypothetical protein